MALNPTENTLTASSTRVERFKVKSPFATSSANQNSHSSGARFAKSDPDYALGLARPGARWRPNARMSRALSKSRAIPRRGLSREEAAVYLGISSTTFDELRKRGVVDLPRVIGGRKLWDKQTQRQSRRGKPWRFLRNGDFAGIGFFAQDQFVARSNDLTCISHFSSGL